MKVQLFLEGCEDPVATYRDVDNVNLGEGVLGIKAHDGEVIVTDLPFMIFGAEELLKKLK